MAAAGDLSPRVLEAVAATAGTAGALQRRVELQPGALGFDYDTGLYLQFRATGRTISTSRRRRRWPPRVGSRPPPTVVAEITARRPGWHEARWVRSPSITARERWSDVVKLLTPIVNDPDLDELYAHAAKIALGTALARLGMFAPALSYLEEPGGPVAVAAVDGALAKALSLRAQGDDETAADMLQDLYAANPENDQVEEALLDPGSASCPPPRPASRPAPIRGTPTPNPPTTTSSTPAPTNARPVLLAEAEQQLGEFIGLDEVKNQVSRLKSSVAMALRRQQRGLTVAQRTHHLVFAGPPGHR